MDEKDTVKFRLDFSAHHSIVVEVPNTEDAEEEAIKKAEIRIFDNDIYADWELDDGGIEQIEDDED